MLKNLFSAISIAALVSACAENLPQRSDQAAATDTVKANMHSPTVNSPKPVAVSGNPPAEAEPITDLWQRIQQGMHWQHPDNPAIAKARRAILRQPNYFAVIAERGSLYLEYIVSQVEARGLPMEVALLPIVESTLSPFSYSSQQAAGLWQIMPTTGQHLGLEQNWWYDGRRDLRASTNAALDYLQAINRDLDGDWLLTLAAYNSGQGRVSRALRRNQAKGLGTDYWSLQLPRETQHYVPRVLALADIISKPEHYGARLPEIANTPTFTVVNTGGQIELARAAQLAGSNLATLQALNPGQLRWATSPQQASELLLPPDSAATFAQALSQLDPSERVQWQHYRIRAGDNLIGIARQFDTEVALIREVNHLKGAFIRAGDTLMIPQGQFYGDSFAAARASTLQTRAYRVRKGDSLYRIAGRFDVSVDDIVSWNRLNPRDFLQPGQKLTLYLRDG